MKNSNLIERLWTDSHEKQSPQRFGRYAVMLLMLLTLGVGQMWADNTHVIAVAGENPNNYTVKVESNNGGAGKWMYTFTRAGAITFEGKKLYVGSYNEKYGCVDGLDIHYYDGNTWKSKCSPFSSWTTSLNDDQVYNEDNCSWYAKKTVSVGARVYFEPDEDWSQTTNKIWVGHANYQRYYSMSRVTNTQLYYGTIVTNGWTNAMGIGVVGGTSASDGTNYFSNASSNSSEYTGLKNWDVNNTSAGNAYLIVSNGDAGETPTMSYYGTHYNTGALNSTQTIKYAVGTNGGTPAELTSGYVPADIAISSYKFSSGKYNAVDASSGSVTLSKGGSNYSATVTAARTATTTYTVSNVHEDYSFLGWYSAPSGGTLLSSELSYTFYPTSATTAYARFSKENNHTVTISRYCTSTSSEINNTSAKIGEVTYSSIEAPVIYGYTFVNWSLGSGVTKHSSDAVTSNPIRVITAASGDYTLTANYTEVLTTDWKLIGDNTTNSPFGDNYNYASGKAMTKKSGYSTEYKAYKTLDITKTGTWGFKVASSSASANIYGWGTGETYITFNRSKSGSKQDVYSGSQHQLKFNPDGLGEYEFKVDYTASPCSVTVTFPTVYTVTFSRGTVDGASGTVTAEYSSVAFSTGTKVQSGKSVTFKAPAAKTGYTFQGWYTVNNGSGSTNRVSTEQNYTTTITADKTLYACYTINNYAITHSDASHGSYTIKVGSAEAVSTNTTSDYGKTITLAATPATGYHFGSWSAYKTGTPATTVTVTSNQFTMPDYAVTVGATFTPNTYTVHFHRNGGAGDVVEQNFTYDVAQNLTANTYTKTGYNFAGWATAADGSVVYADEANVSNLTSTNNGTYHLYAKWTPKTATISYSQSGTGYSTGGQSTTKTATYDAAMPTPITTPTAANGWAFMGYYDALEPLGTQYYNADGTSARTWDKEDASVTLYAYFKKAEITAITFDAAVVEASGTVSFAVTVSPTPTGTTKLCFTVLHSNDNPLAEQPTITYNGATGKYSFTAPEASGTYKVKATLRTGSSCDGGTELDTEEASFQVAGLHTVTVQFKCGDEIIKASETVTGRPLDLTEITAPEIVGYAFSKWKAGDGITIEGADGNGEKASATINFTAIYDGKLTAIYTQKRMIYFYNTLNWENVYVYFYKDGNYWDSSKGSGTDPSYYSGSHNSDHKGQMLPVAEGSKIYYFDAEGASIPAGYTNVAFTEKQQDNCWYFYDNNKVVRRSDYHATTMPLFVPLSDQPEVKKNSSNTASYYCEGYWMNYPANSGYTLRIYNAWNANNATGASREYMIPFSEDVKMPLKQEVEVNSSGESWFIIYRNDGTYLEGSHTFKQTDHGDKKITSNADASKAKKMRLISDGSGIYTFTLTFRGDGGSPENYDYYLNVDFPAAVGDYRIVYSDNATWSNGAHGAGWYHPSDIIGKNTSETDAKEDTVSFFISHGSSPSMKFQRISAISESAGSYGKITWEDVPSGSITIPTSITASGVYNFIVTQPAGGASISLVKAEPYTGNYYIRTDCAGETKWNNFRSPDHLITYSEYSITHGGYSHYYAHWVQTDDKKNIQFCIANDYSSAISDTLIRENNSDPAWANINNYIDEDGDLKRNANVRFMWNQSTNKVSRAYVDGAQDEGSRFLVISSTDGMIKKADGSALSNNEVTFSDNENWIYEANVKAQPNALIKLKSTWGESNTIEQYFKGSSSTTEKLIGGSGSLWYDIRILYDFKTNRLIASYIPVDENIESEKAIEADIMFIREHQGDIAQLTFGESGKISKIETAYGVMRFNKWTLANKDKSTHTPLASPASIYERSLFWISFPFKVKLSEVIGFGSYGEHWAIQRYDGAARAQKGHFLENGSFWRWMNRNTEYLEPNQGYLLAIDLDLLGESSDVWGPASRSEQIELYFPSYGTMPDITNADVEQTIPSHECTINWAETQGLPDTGDPRTSYNRTIFDSHWNVMSVPTYVNTDDVSFVNDTWTGDHPSFLYTWNADDNTITATSASDYTYHAMHAYMVQYGGDITWSASSGSPASIVARRTYAEQPREVEFRLELQQNEKMIDRTYVALSDDEETSAGFRFGEDMTKEYNNKSSIYTSIPGEALVAGNTLPMSNQTTVVPVGVDIKANGDYTFAMPEGTSGIGVTLIDNETGVRTNLGLMDYTVTLTAGTYDQRFTLEIPAISSTPTGMEEVTGDGLEVTGARKVIIDQKMYIIKDGQIFDARGSRVK